MTWQGVVKEVASFVGVVLWVSGGMSVSWVIANFIVHHMPTVFFTLVLTFAIFFGGIWAFITAYNKLRPKKGSAK